MSFCKTFGFAIFAAICLVGQCAGSARAECNPAAPFPCATEWSGGSVINLGAPPGSTYSDAYGINDAGQVVGYSAGPGVPSATEWNGGSAINLGGLPGATYSFANGINDAGQAVGSSDL